MSARNDDALPPELVRAACGGDEVALQQLLAAHLPELQVFVRLNMGEHLRARESVSDVCQSLAGDLLLDLGRETFDDLGAFRAFLRRAALNKIVDKCRHHGREKRGGDRQADLSPSVAEGLGLAQALRALPSPSQVAIGQERAERLELAMQRLPDDQRQVVSMKQLCGMSHEEIAVVLGRSETACRMLLHRGMVRLARELELLGGAQL
ncbi:MAG: sigma-70 family RNA polymerase sigma factor [Planctomycetes bacterium]|nr:sigma-70 family RNA polymerase sigma factor [Planctomycetota bacterium]